MSVNRITFTGADDNTYINDMVALSIRYPQVEWGILVSRKNTRDENGSDSLPRYPSKRWIKGLQEVPENFINRSLHICGEWAREINDGYYYNNFVVGINGFKRIQINGPVTSLINIGRWAYRMDRHTALLNYRDRVILQSRDPHRFPPNDREYIDWLFDQSGGLGKTPDEWPLNNGGNVGYAGGINPGNVRAITNMLNDRSPNPYWIDMETGVRDSNDQFSIDMCYKVCEEVFG